MPRREGALSVVEGRLGGYNMAVPGSLEELLDFFRSEDIARVLRYADLNVPRLKDDRIDSLCWVVESQVFGLGRRQRSPGTRHTADLM